jgi:hypothetical protein
MDHDWQVMTAVIFQSPLISIYVTTLSEMGRHTLQLSFYVYSPFSD